MGNKYLTYNGQYVIYNGMYVTRMPIPPETPTHFFNSSDSATYYTLGWFAAIQHDYPVASYEI